MLRLAHLRLGHLNYFVGPLTALDVSVPKPYQSTTIDVQNSDDRVGLGH